eukprot:TRINITY_DN6264_c0_g3_i1.p2 TRINITY_DN6264_c0_g3~~TRINITY_DN6264_c0_g3_i1.p2  ORF type:complete len:129 (-),score=9.04 TRINITY_DN6264_c0_g3_i1:1015-1401(-)
MALGRAAEWRACVEVYMQEPSLHDERTLENDVRQQLPVPPAGRPRRPAPKARQWNAIADNHSGPPQLPDVHAQRVRRPAPKARQRPSNDGGIQPAEAQVTPPDDGQDHSVSLPTINVSHDESDVPLSQ